VGLIDRTGKVVLAPEFEDRAAFVKDKKYGFVDRSGKVAVAPVYSHARPYEKGPAFVLDKGRSMYVDERFDVVWSRS